VRNRRGVHLRRPIIGLLSFSIQANDNLYYGADATYVRAIVKHGGFPFLLPLEVGVDAIPLMLDQIDGLLIPGGTDITPEQYGESPRVPLMPADRTLEAIELPLVRRAYEENLPVLGICRGNQALAVALGGTLFQDLRHDIGTNDHSAPNDNGWSYHEIQIEHDSRIGSILGCASVLVNSWHHQAIRTIPEDLVVAAKSRDGIIEGIEAPSREFFIGIQCHPEELWNDKTPQFQRLFHAFIQASTDHATKIEKDDTVRTG